MYLAIYSYVYMYITLVMFRSHFDCVNHIKTQLTQKLYFKILSFVCRLNWWLAVMCTYMATYPPPEGWVMSYKCSYKNNY